MSKRRVVITGIGIVSPVGKDLTASWNNIINGVSGIANITHFDASNLATQIAGEIKDFSTEGYLDSKDARRMDRFIQLGMVAGIQAVRDSGIEDYVALNKQRVGLIIGSGIGGLPTIEENSLLLRDKGPRRINPFFIPGALGNMIAGQLSIIYGYTGVNYGVVSACASSNHCIGDAKRYIEYGDCDIMLAGGAESTICGVGIAGFNALKALSTRNDDPTKASRPWDRERDGFVMGEGSAVFVLEEYEHAKKRGAKIYAEVVGYGASGDANHITAPTIAGPAQSMHMALNNAQITPEQIGYVNAHGTSTPLGDINETNAIKQVFADHAYNLSVSSTKSMTGHLLGAASAIEAVFTVMAIKDGVIPPTINLHDPDPECDLDYTANEAKQRNLDYAMSNSFGFGGTNSTIIFKKIA
ncbi:MAG: beta-ketoacyl-ACP synthase [Pseudomonadota bacterium]|jgi:3-oxoacyl-[acyl-carrier-protein] synthase II